MKKLQSFVAILALGFIFLIAPPALAEPLLFGATSQEQSCNALRSISPDGGTCTEPTGRSVSGLMRLAINLVSIIAGVIAVIMIIVAGLKYVTSQGDANSISSAKQALIYAIIGIVVVALAQFIVQFVLSKTIQS